MTEARTPIEHAADGFHCVRELEEHRGSKGK